MKSLTELIIDKLVEIKNSQQYIAARLEFEKAIAAVEQIEREATFECVGRVMMKHLAVEVTQYHPHHTVIITSTTCELVEGVKSVGNVYDYIVDESN